MMNELKVVEKFGIGKIPKMLNVGCENKLKLFLEPGIIQSDPQGIWRKPTTHYLQYYSLDC